MIRGLLFVKKTILYFWCWCCLFILLLVFWFFCLWFYVPKRRRGTGKNWCWTEFFLHHQYRGPIHFNSTETSATAILQKMPWHPNEEWAWGAWVGEAVFKSIMSKNALKYSKTVTAFEFFLKEFMPHGVMHFAGTVPLRRTSPSWQKKHTRVYIPQATQDNTPWW